MAETENEFIVSMGRKFTRDILIRYENEHVSCLTEILFFYLQGTWLGVIHHAVNEHEWVLPYKIGSKSKCLHGPLTEEREKGWLEAESPAHGALRDIMKDKRLLKKVPYYLNCRCA